MDTWNRLVHGPSDHRKRGPVDNKRRLKLLISYAPGQPTRLSASRDQETVGLEEGRAIYNPLFFTAA